MNNTDKKECIDKASFELAINCAISLHKKRLDHFIKRANEADSWGIKRINYEEAACLCERIAELEDIKDKLANMTTLD